MKKLIFSIAIVVASYAHADIQQLEAQLQNCADSDAGISDSIACYNNVTKSANAELNATYKTIKSQLMKSTDADSKVILKRLVTAERAWIAYRDADCSFRSTTMLNGSGERLIVSGCIASKTIEQAKVLKDHNLSK